VLDQQDGAAMSAEESLFRQLVLLIVPCPCCDPDYANRSRDGLAERSAVIKLLNDFSLVLK
jgi:hypothetical protein